MKKLVLMLLASIAFSGGVVYASSNVQTISNSFTGSNQMVYVVKDVTEQANYHIKSDTYNKDHQLISSETIKAPRGSLVSYEKKTLVEALAANEDYVLIQNDQKSLHKQLDEMHKTIYNRLNPTSQLKTSSAILPNTCSRSYKTSSGYFNAYNATINYAIDFNVDNATCSVNPTKYSVWQSQGTGTAWLSHYDWAGHIVDNNTYPQVPYYAANAMHPALGPDWYAASGQNFTTEVQGNNILGTYYSGYVTLSLT